MAKTKKAKPKKTKAVRKTTGKTGRRQAPPAHVGIIKTGDFQWVNVTKNSVSQLTWLQHQFDFHDLDIEDCRPMIGRAKLVDRGDYLFMALLFPIYNHDRQEIHAAEVDFFISHEFLVVVHDNKLPPLKDFFLSCQDSKGRCEEVLEEGPANLLYELLNRLNDYCFPMLQHISRSIDTMADTSFHPSSDRDIYRVATIKQNIVNFRKTMQSHQVVVGQLVTATERFFPTLKLDMYFNDLLERSKEIWTILENDRETVNALYETRSSLTSFHLSQVIKILTIISVIFMPINLMAFLFSMRTVGAPVVGHPFDFWIILGVMVTVGLLLVLLFKKSRWW